MAASWPSLSVRAVPWTRLSAHLASQPLPSRPAPSRTQIRTRQNPDLSGTHSQPERRR
jgi:hypothetical protein